MPEYRMPSGNPPEFWLADGRDDTLRELDQGIAILMRDLLVLAAGKLEENQDARVPEAVERGKAGVREGEEAVTLNEYMQKWLPDQAPSKREEFLRDTGELMKPPDDAIWVSSTVSHRDLRPVVDVRVGSFSFQISPDEARKIGRDFYEVAGGAEMDAICYQYFTGQVGLDQNVVAGFLADLRKWRDEHMQINQRPAGRKQ